MPWPLQESETVRLIHTGLQAGDTQRRKLVNRFNGLLVPLKTSGGDLEKPLKRFS
jgi:hypothetical protein